MSLRITGDKEAIGRNTNLPASSSAMTVCVFAKMLVAHATYTPFLMFFQGGGGSWGNEVSLNASSEVKAANEWGTNETAPVTALTAAGASGTNWTFVAYRTNGVGSTGLKCFARPLSGSMVSQTTANTYSTTLDDMRIGDAPFSPGQFGVPFWFFDGLLAHIKIFDRALSDEEVLAESQQAAPATTTGLISYHSFVGSDVAAAMNPTQGTGAFVYRYSAPSMSTDDPTFVAPVTDPTLSGSDTLPSISASVDVIRQSKTDRKANLVNNFTITFDQQPLSGSTVILGGAVARYGDYATIISSVTDNWGNTYSLGQYEHGNNENGFVFGAEAVNVVTGTPFTITATFTTAESNNISAVAMELDGVTAAPLDKKVNGNSVAATSTSTASSGQLAQENEILIGFGSTYQENVVAPAGWNPIATGGILSIPEVGSWAPGYQVSYKPKTERSAETYSFSHNLGAAAALLYAFKLKDTGSIITPPVITSTPNAVSVQVGQVATATARITLNGQPVEGATITLTSNNANITAALSGPSDANGNITITLTGLVTGTTLLTLTGSNVTSTISVTVAGASTSTGTVSDVIISNDPNLTTKDVDAIVTSGSPAGYAPFVPFMIGDYTFRNAIVKTSITTGNNVDARLSNLTITIDVPDVFDSGQASVLSTGSTITFNRAFTTPPDVTVTQISASAFGAARISAVTKTGFTVQVVNAANTGIAASIAWNALGY
jgi:hypothetical protein